MRKYDKVLASMQHIDVELAESIVQKIWANALTVFLLLYTIYHHKTQRIETSLKRKSLKIIS